MKNRVMVLIFITVIFFLAGCNPQKNNKNN